MIIKINSYYYLGEKKIITNTWEVDEPDARTIELGEDYPNTFKKIKEYLDDVHFTSYYYNCHVYNGIYHVDFGSHTHFIEFYQLYGGD